MVSASVSEGSAPIALGGEMGERVRAFDWGATPLGPAAGWSDSLKLAAQMMLASGFPMALRWGPQLILLYNDAYAPILRDRHPAALGRPFRQVWAEVGDDLAPPQEEIVAGRSGGFFNDDLMVQLLRDGVLQDAHFTVSYGAVPDATTTSGVGGVLITAVETTDKVRISQALRASEARYELALSAAGGVGTWDWDVARDRVFADEAFARLYNVDPKAAADGAPISAFVAAIHPEDSAAVHGAITRAIETLGDFSEEYRLLGPDGEARWVHARGRALRDEAGSVHFPGVVIDITGRKRAETHLQLMVHELNHRVKNSLATVQSLAAQSFRGAASLAAAQEAFMSRLVGLSRAHDVLTDENWEAAGLTEVVETAARLHGGLERFEIDGPALRLSPKAVLALAMALHELGTNAAKYGSLSNAFGRVQVRWRVEDGARFALDWREAGGPPVSPPDRRGFGSRLLEQGLAAELGGTVRLDFAPGGLVCRLAAPLDQLR